MNLPAVQQSFSILPYAVLSGGGLLLLVVLGVIIARLYKRASKEIGFVRTGFGGEKVVMNGGALVLPIFHETMPVNMNTVRLAVERKNSDALITLDRLRIDVKAEFYVRVKPDAQSIATAAQTLGMRTMHPEALKELVEGKFVDALRSVAAGMTMNQLHEQRSEFVQKVQQVSSVDLAMNGLELESVSLTGLDQTSIEHFNANNAFDAEGLTKLTEQIELRKKARNDIEQDTRVQIETKNLEAQRQSLLIARDTEFARLEQEREVEMRRAEQAAEVAREQSLRQQEAEQAKIEAKKLVDSQQIEADRAVRQAKIAQEQALELARQEQQIAVQNKSREESQAKAEADAARAKAVAAEEQVTTSRATEVAERTKRIELIDAAREAERAAISVRVQADAEKQAAADRAHPAARAHRAYCRSSTTTDLGGSVTLSVPPLICAPVNGAGLTVSGASNVLCELIAGAVRMRPETPPALRPSSFTVTVLVWFGSRLDRPTCTLPSLPRTADPLTAGITNLSLLYQGDAMSIGSTVASCQGLYISNTW